LWREGRRDREETDDEFRLGTDIRPEDLQLDLERVALRAALARRRAKWVTRLVESSIVWHDPVAARTRLLVIERGEIVTRAWVSDGALPPAPPGHARGRDVRHDGFTVARFDRLRVLLTELKRLLAEGAPVAIRFSDQPALSNARLSAALSWL
jgi:hypothetical protein